MIPTTDSSPRKLKVLSLNTWGLKFVADKRRERALAIADWIARSAESSSSRDSYHSDSSEAGLSTGYDVVALQELWVRGDFDIIASRAKEAGLVHSRFFYSGAIGAGLAILSAHPIVTAFVMPYPLNGHALHFIEGDFFAGKAVCGVTIDVPKVGKVDVLNTHMYAPGGDGDGVDGAHRVAQAWELARIVNEKVERGRHVILMGDLNSQPQSIIIRILLSHGTLNDSFAQTHPTPPDITSAAHLALSPLEVLHTHGITCDSPLNTYSGPKLAKRDRHCEEIMRGGKRLDYVLYRSPDSVSHRLVAEETNVVLTEVVQPLGVSYSDHFGLEAVLSLLPAEALTNSSGRAILPKPMATSSEDLSLGLANLNHAYRVSVKTSRSQLNIFGVSVVLVPILAIVSSVQPLRYLSWLFVLLGVTVGAVGATMLYSGFIGGQWEAGGLRNVIGEIEHELSRRNLPSSERTWSA